MARKKKSVNKPSETAVIEMQEIAVPVIMEPLDETVCGINGCRTAYEDPVLMQRHKERVHGINIVSLNHPQPRNAEKKLA